MPNHVHGILILENLYSENKVNTDSQNIDAEQHRRDVINHSRDAINRVSTGSDSASESDTKQPAKISATTNHESCSDKIKTGGITGMKNPMLQDNISRVIRWYKGRCTFEIRKINSNFAWQSRFHDNIIRDETEFKRISDYIVSNPENWNTDKFHPNGEFMIKDSDVPLKSGQKT